MPLLLIGAGIILIITGLKGNPGALWTQLGNDFSGPNNFLYWILAIVILGGLGYIDALKSLSRLFLVLLLVVLLLDNKGVFSQLKTFLQQQSSTQPQTQVANG